MAAEIDEAQEVEDRFDSDLFIDKSYTIRPVQVDGLQLDIYALHNAATTDHDLTGQIIWPAAKILALYLSQHRELFIKETTSILELGAGTGLAGLAAAKLSSNAQNCVLTDNNDRVLELLQLNIQQNFPLESGRPKCAFFSWGKENAARFAEVYGAFDLILGADVVFWPSAIPLLLETVHYFLRKRVRVLVEWSR